MKQKRDMNRTGKVALGVIFLAILSIFLFLFNAASQQVVEVPSLPSIPNQGEIKYYGYKYANYSNIIVSTPAAISCFWKPDVIDDGWKVCEAVFEVENQNNIKPVLSTPVLNFTFANATMRNLILNFSSNFSLYNYTYVNLTEISPGNLTEEIIQFPKRNFSDFTVVPNSINTSLPFAIRVTYEAPKHQGNAFNFSANAAGFSAFIDPDQSSCGTLSTANSIYTLTSDVSASGTCFTISAQNITLVGNAAGRSRNITYNTAASGGTGIDINADNFTLKNITITAGSSTGTVISLDIAANLKATIYNSNLTAGSGTDNIMYMSGENSSAFIYDSLSGSGTSSGTDITLNFVKNNSNVTYVNSTFSSSTSFTFTGTNSFFNFDWYLNAQVNDTANAVLQDANVSAWDRNNFLWLTVLTNANGLIPRSHLPEYKRNTTGTFQLSNFTINATKPGYFNQSLSVNMTTHQFVSFTLNETGVNVTVCRNLDSANTIYTLQKNISSTGTCINITANNITLHGNYNNITYNTGDTDNIYGIYATNVNNTFLNNTLVFDATVGGKNDYGIYLLNIINGSLKNSTIRTSGGSGGNTGIVLSGTSSFTIENTSVTTSDATSHGLSLTSNSTNNSFIGLILKTTGSGANALNLAGTSHNFTIRDSILNASGGSDFLVTGTVNGGNWNFTNVTRSNGTVFNQSWAAGANGTLNVHWYLDVLANYTNGSFAPNANVSAWNVNNLFQLNVLTGSNGRIAQQILLEYTKNNTGGRNYTYYSNYTVNATRPDGLQNLTQSWNMTINRDLVFTFGVIKGANITQAIRVSDTTSKTSRLFRVNTQFLTLKDIAAKILGALRSQSQSLTLNAATSRTFFGIRTLSQFVDLTDAAARTGFLARTSSQAFTLNAATSRFLTIPRTIAQTLTLNDAMSRILGAFRSSSQSFTPNAAISRALSGFRTLSQFVDLTDVAARTAFLVRASSQALTLNASTSRFLTIPKIVSQAFTLNDVVLRTFGGLRISEQSLTLNLATSRYLVFPRNIAQSFTIDNAIVRTVLLMRSASQSLTLNLATSRYLTFPRSVSQIFTLNNAAVKIFGVLRASDQSFTINTAVSKTLLGIRGASQYLTLNNAAARITFLARASSQSLTLNLATSRYLAFPRSVSQIFTLNNVVVRMFRALRAPNQFFSLNAVTTRTASFYRSLLDLLKLILHLPVESPPPSPPSTGSVSGGTSGGGGSITGKVIAPPSLKGKSFSVDKEEITFVGKAGEYQKGFFIITNTGTEKLDIALSVDTLKEYITIPANRFSLNPGESHEVEIELNAPQEPRVYTSKIIITADGIRKEIPLILNIKSPESLFDIKLEIPSNYRTSEAGATITVKATLLRLRGGPGAIDVRLTYLLKDLQDQIILKDTEIVGVDTTGSFFKDIHLPSDLKPGSYVVVAEVSYGDTLDSATALIKVAEKKGKILQWILAFFILAALAGFISYLVLQRWKHKKKSKISKKKSRRQRTK